MHMPSAPPVAPALKLSQISFAALNGWADGDLQLAFTGFRRSCGVLALKADNAALGGLYAGTAADWRAVCAAASTATSSREFFEANFVPYRVSQTSEQGLFTGYYEPELKASRTQHDGFQTPLYGVPADLVTIDLGLFRDALKGQRIEGRVMGNRVVPYPARAEIARAGLPQAMTLFYVDDATDAFFLQIQGSGRIVLDDGSVIRALYAGENGQPYTAIGAVLIERGELKREEVSLQSIRAWIKAHPAEAQELMNHDASYVFFAEQPIGDAMIGAPGAEGVPLTPEASLAVDLSIHALGVPAFLEATAPDETGSDRAFNRLLMMQDTGGAIKGAVRGDVYWGFGKRAEEIAGRMKNQGRLTVLLPKARATRLGASAQFPGSR
ncbi:MAG TPA: MltA domain-containing protein [Micropepsaceae bacterium]|nr:MltA domain-containing protein [Micropepsaceae bacterium]